MSQPHVWPRLASKTSSLPGEYDQPPLYVICRKPYQQYQFRCMIPQDLISYLEQTEFALLIGNSLYSHIKTTSLNLYNLSKFIFREV